MKEKDSENKNFLGSVLKWVGIAGGIAVAVGAAILGANINNKNGGNAA